MAFTCGFFNSENGDRKYNAEQMSAIFDGIIADGVFTTIGDHMAVSAGTGMQVLVGTGKAWFDHTWNVNDAAYPLAIAASDVTLSRIDAIVLETNHSDSVRLNKLRVVQGTVASSPVKPTLTNSEKVHQHPLAWVTVAPGVTQIAASAIENVVGTSACPFVTGVIETTAIDDLFNQWNGEFDEWFNNLKVQLSDNVVVNLQKQIDEAKTAQHTIISDKTATDLGITPKSSTDAALQNLSMVISMIKLNKGGINLTVRTSGGNPISGIRVSGILDADGNELETDNNGKLSGYMNEGSVKLAITNYADIVDYSETITVIKGNIIDKTIIVTVRNFLKITSSKSVKFSGNVKTIDYSVGGGGGGGASSGSDFYQYAPRISTGYGGGGGDCITITNATPQHHVDYPAIIGDGGLCTYREKLSRGYLYHGPTAGGNSSFMGTNATGGGVATDDPATKDVLRAQGNGPGGLAQVAEFEDDVIVNEPIESVKTYLSSFTETAIFGGGGGCEAFESGMYSAKTKKVMVNAGCYNGNTLVRTAGLPNTGGGGYGEYSLYINEIPAVNGGGSGVVTIRMHLNITT